MQTSSQQIKLSNKSVYLVLSDTWEDKREADFYAMTRKPDIGQKIEAWGMAWSILSVMALPVKDSEAWKTEIVCGIYV